MNIVEILVKGQCPAELINVMIVVRFVVWAICIAIPIVLIVLVILDLAKIVTAGNVDDKLKKEVTNKVVTRIIFAVLIFLVPTIIRLIFGILPLPAEYRSETGTGGTWRDCWDKGASGEGGR